MSSRAAFQVLVIPYRKTRLSFKYAAFRRERRTGGYWQFIAGGGEARETPSESARRESAEEAGIEAGRFRCLASMTMVPVEAVSGFLWGPNVLLIPEYCFSVEVGARALSLSSEHTQYLWGGFGEIMKMLNWDSNRTALWELDYRLRNGVGFPREVKLQTVASKR